MVLDGGPGPPQLGGLAGGGAESAQHGTGLAHLALEGQRHRLPESPEGGQRHHPQQGVPAVAGQHGPVAVGLAAVSLPAAGPEAAGAGLQVAHPGRRHHHHPGPDDAGPPREVEVLALAVDDRVESAQGMEQVGPDQSGPGGGDQHLPDAVVLLLVQLARLDQVAPGPDLVRRQADREQPVRVVPLHVLGAGHPGVGEEGLLHEGPHRIRGQSHVVVAEEVVGSPLHHLQHLVGGPSEAGALLQPAHERPGHHGGHCGRRVVPAAGVDHQDRQVGVVLGGEGRQRFGEPRAGVAGHDHGHHGRRRRGGFGCHPEGRH